MTNLALNPFKKGKKSPIEGVKKVNVEGDMLVQYVLKHYKEIDEYYSFDSPYYDNNFNRILEDIIFNPNQVKDFLDKVLEKDIIKSTTDGPNSLTSLFLSKLIKRSYDFGHTTHKINSNSKLNFLGCNLFIKYNQLRLDLEINGDVGNHLGYNSWHTDFVVNGNTGKYFGDKSDCCTYEINGNTERHCGCSTKNSEFIINGNTSFLLGYDSKKSTYVVKGDVIGNSLALSAKECYFTLFGDYTGDSIYADYCIFKVFEKKTFDKIGPMLNDTNPLFLIDEDGNNLEEYER